MTMKYSLRSLMFAALLVPPLLAWLAWLVIPAPKPAWWSPSPVPQAGSPESMKFFLQCISDTPWPPYSVVSDATANCFTVGAPASRYANVFAKAERSGKSPPPWPGGTQYEFKCFGDGGIIILIVVVVDGNPPVIQFAEANVYAF